MGALKIITVDERYSDNNGAYDVVIMWDGEKIVEDVIDSRGVETESKGVTAKATKEEVKAAVAWYVTNVKPKNFIGGTYTVKGSRKVKKGTIVKVVDFADNGRFGKQVKVQDESGDTNWISAGCIAEGFISGAKPFWADCGVEEVETVSFVAEPLDDRCSWWAVQLPDDVQLNGNRIAAPYLRKGADLELKEGDMIVTSEARHHRKNRGYDVRLRVCVDGKVKTIFPLKQRKSFIKANGGQDLMHESGDVAGCVRMAVWLRRQPNLSEAFRNILNA